MTPETHFLEEYFYMKLLYVLNYNNTIMKQSIYRNVFALKYIEIATKKIKCIKKFITVVMKKY